MLQKHVSNVRADIDRHADDIKTSIDETSRVLTLALVGIGVIAVTALVIAASNGSQNGG